jgi:hypothetical protein
VGFAVLLGALAAYGWSSRQPVRYEGVVRMYLTSSVGAGQGDGQPGTADANRNVRNQVELLTSPAVLEKAVALTGGQPSRQELEDRLTVESQGDADVITIRVPDATPKGAAKLAEAVPLAYRRLIGERTESAARETIRGLQQTQEKLNAELAEIDAALQAQPNDPSLEADRKAVIQQLAAIATRKQQVSIDADLATRPGALPERAVVSDEPAQPQPRRTAAMGALLGLAVGVAMASWGAVALGGELVDGDQGLGQLGQAGVLEQGAAPVVEAVDRRVVRLQLQQGALLRQQRVQGSSHGREVPVSSDPIVPASSPRPTRQDQRRLRDGTLMERMPCRVHRCNLRGVDGLRGPPSLQVVGRPTCRRHRAEPGSLSLKQYNRMQADEVCTSD